jgi:hypothetical protein
MRKLPFILAFLAILSPQASLTAAVPSKLYGVIVMSCVTTAAGAKVDEEIYKIDFVKKQVNNKPVEFEITDISLGWTYLPKRTGGGIDIDGSAAINRYSGKLESGIQWSNSKRLTVCRVAGARKF